MGDDPSWSRSKEDEVTTMCSLGVLLVPSVLWGKCSYDWENCQYHLLAWSFWKVFKKSSWESKGLNQTICNYLWNRFPIFFFLNNKTAKFQLDRWSPHYIIHFQSFPVAIFFSPWHLIIYFVSKSKIISLKTKLLNYEFQLGYRNLPEITFPTLHIRQNRTD